jgi:hypothetical protein
MWVVSEKPFLTQAWGGIVVVFPIWHSRVGQGTRADFLPIISPVFITLFADLAERGLATNRALLIVIDGAKALHKAVSGVFRRTRADSALS